MRLFLANIPPVMFVGPGDLPSCFALLLQANHEGTSCQTLKLTGSIFVHNYESETGNARTAFLAYGMHTHTYVVANLCVLVH